jgi:hypothetical protein
MPPNFKKILASVLPEFRILASCFSSAVRAHLNVAGAYTQHVIWLGEAK